MEASLPLLSVHQLHSQPAAGASAQPRVSLWLHSMMTSHKALVPCAQDFIDQAAAATGAPWTAVLMDSRCHGESAALALPPPHTVDAMAEDALRTYVAGFEEGRWGPPEVIVGHSIGGLQALEVAQRLGAAAKSGAPRELAALGVPRQVWTLDSRLLAVPPDNPAVEQVRAFLAALFSPPQPMPSLQSEIDVFAELLRAQGIDTVPEWGPEFCSRLVEPAPGGSGGLVRHADGSVFPEMLASYHAKDFTALLRSPPPGLTVHPVRGLASSVWQGADGERELALFHELQAGGGRVRLAELGGATHWIPMSHRPELVAAMLAALREQGREQPAPAAAEP